MKIYNKNIYWQKLVDNENSNTRSDSSVEGLIDTYHYIFNCANNTIDYVSDTFEFVTGRKKSRFSISTFLDMIHPDDIEHYFLCEERSQQFSNSLSFGEHFRYRMDYAYRIQKQDGSYMTIRQQRQAIDINAQGHLTKTCIMHQKIQEVPGLPVNDYYVFDKVKNELVDTNNVFNLTKREQHIFDLIRDGLSSNEIADKLNLSRHTVDTHRKNILKRTNTKNFFALQMKFNSVNESMISLAR